MRHLISSVISFASLVKPSPNKDGAVCLDRQSSFSQVHQCRVHGRHRGFTPLTTGIHRGIAQQPQGCLCSVHRSSPIDACSKMWVMGLTSSSIWMTLSRFGQAVALILVTPSFSFHNHLVLLGTAAEKLVDRNLSVYLIQLGPQLRL